MPINGELDIPISANGVSIVTSEQISDQLQTQIMQSGNVAQNNFITVQKAIDYDYLENKRMVTLDEAVGVREVTSKVSPGGPAPATT